MIPDQTIVFGVLCGALVLFVAGRWRYDIVALLALLTVGITGIVPAKELFLGFGHPAVVTVAAVLVVSQGLQNSGIVDLISKWLKLLGDRPIVQMTALTVLVAVLSGFMNNVGALALLMPVAIRKARKMGQSPSLFLMPLAFGSLLGGLTTLIGTPPNIIIATYREEATGAAFSMFDFAPVGVGIAISGIIFISLVGWRLLPKRKGETPAEEMFKIEDYVTEVRVPEDSEFSGKRISELEAVGEKNVAVVGIVRGDTRLPAPSGFEKVWIGDILILQSDSEALKEFIDTTKLELVGSEDFNEDLLKSEDVTIVEAVVVPGSNVIGKTSQRIKLRLRHGVNLLAVARQNKPVNQRVSKIKFRVGDVLLLQGGDDTIQEILGDIGCLPLASRGLKIGMRRRTVLSASIFIVAIALTVLKILPVQVSLTTGAVAMVLLGMLTLNEAYKAIDWPVIVLLAAMIPVGQAMDTTGGAQLIADTLVNNVQTLPAWASLLILMVGTMSLSNVINNAAAAVLMAPISVSVAHSLGASIDPFLMAVAIGSSSAFLTPIGHQSNTIVMRPGGYKFGDYWKMGLPLEIVIVLVSMPLILFFWPL